MRIRDWITAFVAKVAGNPMIRVDGLRMDAGETALLTQQLEAMMTELFNTEYPELKTRRFFPVDNSQPNGARTVAYRQYDQAGRAKYPIANYGDDIPLVNVQGRKHITPIIGLAAGYEISIQDLRAAAMAGVPIDTMLADAARVAIEQGIDEIAAVGDADAGIEGFLNHSNIPTVTALTGTWSTASAEDIIADVEELWHEIPIQTNQLHYPNTLILDPISYKHTSKHLTNASVSVKKYLLENLEGLTGIDQWHRLQTAGAAGVSRIMAYQKSPRTGRILIPQEFESFPPQERNLSYIVPCHARCGGAMVPYPLAFGYMDGTGA
jgi:hypothetical protein